MHNKNKNRRTFYESFNVATDENLSIDDIARVALRACDANDIEIEYDTTKPDGTPRKLMDVSKLTNLGWKATISLEEGIKKVYEEIKDSDWLTRM